MMTAKMTEIGRRIGSGTIIGQDTMIIIGRIKIRGAIIETMTITMIIGEKMTVKMITIGIVVTIMTLTIHQGMIEMIDALTRDIDIMMIKDPMIKGEMMTINKQIVDTMMKTGMTIGAPRRLDSFNIILKREMTRSHRMFGNHVMRKEKLMGRQNLIAISAEKMNTMQISV